MKSFVSYEISPVAELTHFHGGKSYEAFPTLAMARDFLAVDRDDTHESQQLVWGLYGITDEGFASWIADFHHFMEASALYVRITGCPLPLDDSRQHKALPAHARHHILIEVSGGVADLDSDLPPGVRLTIWDHDNEEATPEGEVYEPVTY